MKNKLVDLNNHLFMQLERLGDESLTEEELQKEVSRTEAIVDVSGKIIENAKVAVAGAKVIAEHGDSYAHIMPGIGYKSNNGGDNGKAN